MCFARGAHPDSARRALLDRGRRGDRRQYDDRPGELSTTPSIGAGTKIDNFVHIAHNVRVGKLCLIMAQVGVAGRRGSRTGASWRGRWGLRTPYDRRGRASLAGRRASLATCRRARSGRATRRARTRNRSARAGRAVQAAAASCARSSELVHEREQPQSRVRCHRGRRVTRRTGDSAVGGRSRGRFRSRDAGCTSGLP